MTEDKIYDLWERIKMSYKINTSQKLENFISGEEKKENITLRRFSNIYYYPDELVKELKGKGENADIAERILYVISQINNNGLLISRISDSDVNVCKMLGYSFMDIINDTKFRFYDTSHYYHHINEVYKLASAFVKAYEDEIAEIKKIDFKDNQLILWLFIMTNLFLKDTERYSYCLETVGENIDKIPPAYGIYIACRLWNYDESMKKFIVSNLRVLSHVNIMECVFKETMGLSLKTVLFDMNEQQAYYRYMINKTAGGYYTSKIFFDMLNEAYDYDKEMFVRIYEKDIESSVNVFMLAKMIKNGDEIKDCDKVMEKYVSKMRDRILNDINRRRNDGEKLSPVEFIRLFSSDNLEEAASKISVVKKYGYFASHELSALYSLYDYNKTAKNMVKFMLLNFYINGDKNYEKNLDIAVNILSFMQVRKYCLDIPEEESLKLIVNEILPVDSIFKSYCALNTSSWYKNYFKFDKNIFLDFIKMYPKEALEYFSAAEDASSTVAWLGAYYSADFAEKSFEPVIKALKSKAKTVRIKAMEIAENYESEIRPKIEAMLPKLKGTAEAAAAQIIKKWDNVRKFGKDFAFTSNEFTEEFCKENFTPLMKRKISWIDESCFEGIRYADMSGTAAPEIIEYIISEYMIIDEPYRISLCDKAAERLNKSDLQAALENIFKFWVESGADTKKKFITLPYCLYASDSQIISLKKQLETWAAASRGQLASFVVGNMALNGGAVALLTVDSISRKFPSNMVKSAAKSAFAYTAKVLGVPVDELSDKIIPSLGFSKSGERIFDYGSRTFTVSLMPDFTLSIHDNAKNKDIKSMPKPNANDDAAKAEAAKKEFSELKKQIKTVTATQKQRLEKVFMNGRTWTAENWRNLFEENAVMHCFAEKLVWGVYENGKVKSTFRYLSDGSFCNEDDDEYELPEKADITLVHPVDIEGEVLEKWKEQFDDYEIVQPFIQLNAEIIKLSEKDIEDNQVSKYIGKSCKSGKMAAAAKKYNMLRGAAGDGGSFEGYDLVDDYLGIYLHIDGDVLYFGQDYNEDVNLEEIKFKTVDGDYVLNPLEVNKRFVSCCMEIIENMTDM